MQLLGDVGHVESHFLTHSMVPLGDEAELKAHFGPFGDSTNLDAR